MDLFRGHYAAGAPAASLRVFLGALADAIVRVPQARRRASDFACPFCGQANATARHMAWECPA